MAELVLMYSASMDVPHYWTADQVRRLLDALAAHNRHRSRTAALIMWRTGLRVSEVLELEWRDLDYAGDPATLLVRKSKSRSARTVRLHQDLVQLFTNWPANRSPRDKRSSTLTEATAWMRFGVSSWPRMVGSELPWAAPSAGLPAAPEVTTEG